MGQSTSGGCQSPKFFVGHVHTVQYLTALLCPLEDFEGGRGLVLRYFSTHFYGFIQSTEFNEAQENRWVRVRVRVSVSFSERNGLTCEGMNECTTVVALDKVK